MLYLKRESSNLLAVNANQSLSSPVSDYYWRFKRIQGGNVYQGYFEPDLVTDRYVEFTITLPADFSADTLEGDYEYFIYSGDGVSTDTDTMELVEVGKAVVEYTPEEKVTHFVPSPVKKVFGVGD